VTPGPDPDRPDLRGWPVNLLVAGRRVVVVGAGRIAARKIASLLALDADVHVVAPEFGRDVEAWHADGTVSASRRAFTPADLDGAWLAVTATDDPATNAAVHDAAEARRIWCNSADDPANCSFTLLSVLRRSDVVVAIGTGGRSPALAKWLRERIEAELGDDVGALLDVLAEAREEMRAAGRSSEDADWQLALQSGMVELVRDGRLDEAKELLRSCL
jgi:siroheme synthase-like protein